MQAGLDPDLMHTGFRLPKSRAAPSAAMLAEVRALCDGEPYVLVHDDAERPLLVPDSAFRVLHVDDPRFASHNIFDYVDVLRNARHLHAIDSCFALLVDLADLGTEVTVHVYAKGPRSTCNIFRRDNFSILQKLPAGNLGGSRQTRQRHVGVHRALEPGRSGGQAHHPEIKTPKGVL